MAIYEIVYTRRKLSDDNAPVLDTPAKAAEFIRANCMDPDEMWREKAFALFLDKKKRLLSRLLISVGTSDSTAIDTRLVVKAALDSLASGVILTHNHPSGDPTPGGADLTETKRLRQALESMDITLCDHIIIGDDEAYSMSVEKRFKIKNHESDIS